MRRRIVGIGLAVSATLAFALPASAHVTVNPKTAEQGSYAKLTFRVPTEETNATTTKVEVNIPTDHPITSIGVQPTPGWTYALDRSTLPTPVTSHGATITDVVSKITWTADPTSAIKPGEFNEFNISAGPMPKDASDIAFKAVQTYSNGDVVRWIDIPATGAAAEHPAPTLALTAPAPANDAAGKDLTITTEKVTKETDMTTRTLAIVGVALGAAAVGLTLTARRRKP
jgi:uncharacterized protein YcnI